MNLGSGVVSDAASWSLLVGSLMPLVVQHLTNFTTNRRYQSLIAFAACVAAGAGTAYFAGDLTGKTLVSAALVVYVASETTYQHFWNPTGVTPTTTKAKPNTVGSAAIPVSLGDGGAPTEPPGGATPALSTDQDLVIPITEE